MKTKTLITTGAIVLSVLILSSCSDWGINCIHGNGNTVSEHRVTSSFAGVESNGSFDVVIDTGNETSVYVEADENLMEHIITSVRGNRLVIETRRDRCLRSDNPILVYITTPELYDVALRGSGQIDCGGLETSELDVELEGSGTVNLDYVITDEMNMKIEGSGSIRGIVDAVYIKADIEGSGDVKIDDGSAHTADFVVNGSGRIKADDMNIDNCYVEINGSGDVYAFVYDLLDVTISGSGTVYYYGNPSEVVKRIYGSGKVVKR